MFSGVLGVIRQSMSEGMDLDDSCPERQGEAEEFLVATDRLRRTVGARIVWL